MNIDSLVNVKYTYYILNDKVYTDLQDIHDEFIENYIVQDDEMTDFVTDEEDEALEVSGAELLNHLKGKRYE